MGFRVGGLEFGCFGLGTSGFRALCSRKSNGSAPYVVSEIKGPCVLEGSSRGFRFGA